MQNLDLKAGELICFSEGAYSDYGYNGHFVVLQDVSESEMEQLARDLIAEESEMARTGTSGHYGFAKSAFIPRAIRNGWLLSVNCREIHTGSYGSLELIDY